MTVFIAMWSGPRNISTAMMRSWDARPDAAVIDEPFYACYLEHTGLQHPGFREIIDAGETDPARVIGALTSPPRGGEGIVYQKHMAHHMLPQIPLDWTSGLRNAFLIREPRAMLASLLQVLPNPDLDATGLPRQLDLFERCADRLGRTPPVIDSKDVLLDPPAMLRGLCAALDVPYAPAMLAWAPGPRATDGVWAKHWYASVERSTGFAPYREKDAPIPRRYAGLLRECVRLYDRLAECRLRGAADKA